MSEQDFGLLIVFCLLMALGFFAQYIVDKT